MVNGKVVNEDDMIIKLAEPLVKYVNEMDPYISVIVKQGSISITRDERHIPIEVPD